MSMDITQLVANNPQLAAALGMAQQPARPTGPVPAACEAASEGNIDALATAVAEDASMLTVADSDGWTPLITAAQAGHAAVVEWLAARLPKDALNTICKLKSAPAIHYAVANTHVEAADALLAAGADPNATDGRGWRPIHLAAQTNAGALVESLVAAGADVNALTSDKISALYIAVARDNNDAAEALVRAGADTHGCNGNSLLHVAATKNAVGVLIWLASDVNRLCPEGIDAREPKKQTTPLMAACTDGNIAAARALADAGADVTAIDADGWTAVHFAATSGSEELLELIEERIRATEVEFDAGVRDSSGITPLHLAVARRHVDAAHWLINHGADVDPVDSNGVTPFMIAIQVGEKELAEELSARSDVDLTVSSKKNKLSALHLAASRNYGQVLARVLAAMPAGAANSIADDDGRSPLIMASLNGACEAIAALCDAAADIEAAEPAKGFTPLIAATIKDRTAAVKLLVERGADIEHGCARGVTPIGYAADAGATGAAEIFAKAGADLEATVPPEDSTPMHVAASKRSVGVLRALIDAGANVNAADKDNWTPLVWAIHSDDATPGSVAVADDEAGGAVVLEMVEALIKAGANVNTTCKRTGRTPLHFAVRKDLSTVVSTLLAAGAALEARDGDGNSPLHHAAFWNSDRAAEVLIEAGADVDAKSSAGNTPLQLAVFHEAPKVCRRLAGIAGIDVEALGAPPAELTKPESDADIAKMSTAQLKGHIAALMAKEAAEAKEEKPAAPAAAGMPNCNVA